jgi:hypothetical protein
MYLRVLCHLTLGGALLGVLGCGTGNSKIEGIVTLDEQPVEGATVIFTPADGNGPSGSGLTNAQGIFQVASGDNKQGLPAGIYKVTVVKVDVKVVGTPDDLKADPSKTGVELMMKAQKEGIIKKSPNSGGPIPITKGGMPFMPGKVGLGGSGPKSQLPDKYAKVSSTPFEVKIPHSGRVELKLTKS